LAVAIQGRIDIIRDCSILLAILLQ